MAKTLQEDRRERERDIVPVQTQLIKQEARLASPFKGVSLGHDGINVYMLQLRLPFHQLFEGFRTDRAVQVSVELLIRARSATGHVWREKEE